MVIFSCGHRWDLSIHSQYNLIYSNGEREGKQIIQAREQPYTKPYSFASSLSWFYRNHCSTSVGLYTTVPVTTYMSLSAVSVIVLWLFSGWLLYSFNESVSPWKSCLVKYGVTFTVTYVVLSPPRHNVLGLAVQFLFSGKLRGWSSSSKSTHTCLRAVTLFYFQPLWPHFGNQICVFLPLLSLQIYAHSITSPNVFL